jgi:hypothetical protein
MPMQVDHAGTKEKAAPDYFAALSRGLLIGEGTMSFCAGQVASRSASALVNPSLENFPE